MVCLAMTFYSSQIGTDEDGSVKNVVVSEQAPGPAALPDLPTNREPPEDRARRGLESEERVGDREIVERRMIFEGCLTADVALMRRSD